MVCKEGECMTIEKLNSTKVLISLCREDMEKFRLSINKMSFCNEDSRKVLLRLTELACKEAGVTLSGKTILMEALPLQSGCLILVTFADKKKRRTYKVKSIRRRVVYIFDDAEKMLCAAEILYHRDVELPNHAMWLFADKYYAVFDYCPLQKEVCAVLRNFARPTRFVPIGISRIQEGGRLICDKNALKTIGERISIKNKS